MMFMCAALVRKIIYTLRVNVYYWINHRWRLLGLFYSIKPPCELVGAGGLQNLFKEKLHTVVYDRSVVKEWI